MTLSWTKHSGPDSGELTDEDKPTATFSDPTKGGLYQFDLDFNDKTTRTQLWLPVAGPDISFYWNSEINYFKNTWGPAYRAKLNSRTSLLSPFPIRQLAAKNALAVRDILKIGPVLDWTGQVTGEHTPCGGPNLPSNSFGDHSRQTMYGVVIDFAKRNNMLYALIGREMGLLEIELKHGPDWRGAGTPDDQYAFAAYSAGFDLYNGETLETVMQTRGHSMQVPASWTQKEWPSYESSEDGLTRKAAEQLEALIE